MSGNSKYLENVDPRVQWRNVANVITTGSARLQYGMMEVGDANELKALKSTLLTTVSGSQAARHHQQSVFLIETLFCQDLDSAPFLPRFAVGATVPATESSVLIQLWDGTHSHFLHLEYRGMPHNLCPDRVVPGQEDI